MSEISKELQAQQDKDVGAIVKKLFGDDVPAIDAKQVNEEERKRLQATIDRLNGVIDAAKR